MLINMQIVVLVCLFTGVTSVLDLPLISTVVNAANSTVSKANAIVTPAITNLTNDEKNCTDLVPEDALLTFIGLASKYGYPAESYEVTTEDGYILTVFRIPGKRSALPILLYHGLFDSSDTWILRGNISLAITFARKGYDIWVGNCRGNRYSRGHVKLDPDKDNAYWNYTFNEVGYYDLAATIDLVLNKTGAKKLNAYGHSQGTTIFFVLLSSRPEYNEKINFIAALAPVAYLHHTPLLISTLITLSPILYSLTQVLNIHEVFGNNSFITQGAKVVCPLPIIGYNICVLGVLFPALGYDPFEFGPCYLRSFIGHYPLASSAKNLYHFGQVGLRKKFAQYDYGETGNIIAYNSTAPPEYDLSNIKTKVMLFPGMNDYLSTVPDVEILKGQLPNVVEYTVSPRPECNHMDFVQGKNMPVYLYPYILNLPKKYS